MKLKIVVAILVVVCIGLGVALLNVKSGVEDQHKSDLAVAIVFSNQVLAVNKQVNDLGQVNLTLSNEMSSAQQEISQSAEQITQLSNSLASVNDTLVSAKNSLASAEEQVTNLNARIADLEVQNKVLDDQSASLSKLLAQMTIQIQETRSQLENTRANNGFLQGELQKQLAQKAELEHKFNDVEELRQRIKTLREQLWRERRIQLHSTSTLKKGGEMLMDHRPAENRRPASAYDLNVELGTDGSARIIRPATNSPATNSPAH